MTTKSVMPCNRMDLAVARGGGQGRRRRGQVWAVQTSLAPLLPIQGPGPTTAAVGSMVLALEEHPGTDPDRRKFDTPGLSIC